MVKHIKRSSLKGLLSRIHANRSIYLFISPFFILYSIFGLYALIYSLFLSFTTWTGHGQAEFVGFLNYEYLIKDALFFRSIANTLIIWCLSTIPMVVLALVIAYILNAATLKLKDVFRAIYFLPNVTSTVAVSIIFSTLFANTYGLANFALKALGLNTVKWMSSSLGVQFVIALIVLWRWTGYNAVITLAGLQKIPYSLYEAASIEGASSSQIFRKIVLPMLNPTLIFIVVTSTIGGWQLMEESYMLVGKAGGIGRSGLTVVLYLYNKAFLERQFGYGSAVSWGLFIIICALSFINWKIVQRDIE